jgi:hypothetical protein
MSEYLKVQKDCFIDRKNGNRPRIYFKIKYGPLVEIQVGTTEIGLGLAWFYRQIVWRCRLPEDIIKDIHAGDVLDFLRVLYANKEEGN